MTVTLSGPIWIVKNAPGSADYAHFYKAAVEKGWIFSDPASAKAQPGQAKAMAEMYKQMAAIGGIPYETTVQIKISASGPMGAIMSKMGTVTMTSTVDFRGGCAIARRSVRAAGGLQIESEQVTLWLAGCIRFPGAAESPASNRWEIKPSRSGFFAIATQSP